MSWLTPAIWWLGLLAVAPIALHLLLRERIARVAFPSLRFLRRAAPKLLARRRWLEQLLIALRVVALVLLVAAFARPYRAGAVAGCGPEVAVLLDVSRSMRAGTRMAEAKREAERIIAAAAPDAALTVATFADGVVVAAAVDRDDALARVRAAQTGAGSTDAVAAVDAVVAALRGTVGEIHLVSDLQASAFPRSREPRRVPPGFVVHAHRIGDEPAAGAATIAGAAFPPEVTPGERDLPVSVRIANAGPERAAEVALVVDGKPLDRRAVRLPQDGEAVAALVGTVAGAGDHAGEVVLSGAPVALPGDDRFRFIARVVDQLRVTIIDGRPDTDRAADAAFFVAEALAAGVASPFVVDVAPTVGDLARCDVIVLAAIDALPAAAASALAAFVERGGGVMIGLGPGLDAAAFNAALGDLAPARVRTWVAGDRFLVAGDATEPLVSALIGDGRVDLGAARFTGSADLMDTQGARVTLRFDDGRPALVAARRGAGAVMLFAGCLDRRGGDFPLRPLYVPFIREAMRDLAARAHDERTLAAGESVALPMGATVVDPTGGERAVAAGGPFAFDDVGFWRVRARDGERRYAVNGDPRESRLTALDPSDVELLFAAPPQADVRVADGGRLERVLRTDERIAAERRLNLGWWGLVGLAGLLVAEALVAQAASRT